MNLRDLNYLISVAELGHFGKAAEACFVSQPTLSTQIKKLEDELQVTVFERSNKQVLLTEQGAELVAQARRILQEAQKLKDLAKQFTDPFSGRFHLGVIPTICPYLLPKILPALKQALPQCDLYFYEQKTDDCLTQLRQGHLDAAILALPIPELGLSFHNLYEEPFDLALYPGHTLHTKKVVALDDLSKESFLLLEEGHCFRDQALEICQHARAHEETSYRGTSLETLRAMVAQGIGVTLLPRLATQDLHHPKDITVIPFKKPSPKRTIAMIWREITAKQKCCARIADTIHHTIKDIL